MHGTRLSYDGATAGMKTLNLLAIGGFTSPPLMASTTTTNNNVHLQSYFFAALSPATTNYLKGQDAGVGGVGAVNAATATGAGGAGGIQQPHQRTL